MLKLRAAFGVAALAIGLSVPGLAQEKVTLRLDWVPGAEHAFMYLGRDKGFFTAEGIDLEILGGQGSTVSVKLVGNGDNDFAFADGTTLVRAWETGVPLVVLHVLYQQTPTVLYAKKESGIGKIQDVCGKKIGTTIASTTYVQYKAMLKAAGVTCQLNEIPVGGGGLNEILAGTVDIVHSYTYIHPVLAKSKGIETVEFAARDYFQLYSQTLITNKTLVEKRGGLHMKFYKAAMKSLDYALQNPKENLASFARANKEANIEFERAKLAIVAGFLTVPEGGARKVGLQSAEGWKKTIDTLFELGAIKSKVDPSGKFIVPTGS